MSFILPVYFVVFQSLSHVSLFVIPWTAAHQTSLPLHYLQVCSNSCPLSQWCYLTIHPLPPPSLLPSIFSRIRVFSSESAHHIRWSFSFSFSISPSNEYSGVISLTDLISLLSKGLSRVLSSTTLESVNSLALNCLYGPTVSSICDYQKNHSFDYMGLCQQSDISAF